MSKIILINPNFSGLVFKSKNASIPLGLSCIGSYLKKHGIKVKLIDYLTNSHGDNEIKREILASDFVGLSVMTTQLHHALKICDTIREMDKELPIIFGGVHPTIFPYETIEDKVIDFVVVGEGEATTLDLINTYQKGKKLCNVKGLLYKENDKKIFTGTRPYVDIETIPPIDWTLFNQEMLSKLDPIPIHTSRGCIHNCKFCINSITRNSFRHMSTKKILDELEIIRRKFKNRKICFWDENFFSVKKRVREIVRGIIGRNLNIQWHTTCRADYFSDYNINDVLFDQIKKSGCYRLSFGAESGSQRILDLISKNITPEQIVNSAIKCKKHNIIPEYSFIIGLPSETRKDINLTIKLIYNLKKINPKAEIIGPQPFRPYPGSELYEMCLTTGWKGPSTLRQWAYTMEREWNYLSPHNFPWIKNPNFIEALWPYISYATASKDHMFESGIKINKFLKLLFISAAKTRWIINFFDFPIEYMFARLISEKFYLS